MNLSENQSCIGIIKVQNEKKKCLFHVSCFNGKWNCFVYNILQNIFFCIMQNKETHTGLEWHEAE